MNQERIVGRPWPAAHILSLKSKIGGLPVGLFEHHWPTCRQCGRHLDFLLQLHLKNPVSLGNRYSWAYLFMCSGYTDRVGREQCDTWYPAKGASHITLLESPDPTTIPRHMGVRQWPEFDLTFGPPWPDEGQWPLDPILAAAAAGAEVEIETVVIMPRTPAERSVPKKPRFEIIKKRPKSWTARIEIFYRPPDCIQLGGSPLWVQSDQTPNCPKCGGPMKLMAQINAQLEGTFRNENPTLFPFGSGGVAYAFLCESECSPEGTYFMWQTT